MKKIPETLPTKLVKAASGLGQHVLCCFMTRLVPVSGGSAPSAVIQESSDVEWHGFATVEGRLVAQFEGRNLADTVENLEALVSAGIPPEDLVFELVAPKSEISEPTLTLVQAAAVSAGGNNE